MAIYDPDETEEKKRKQELLAQKMDATPLPPMINPNPATPLPTEYAGFVRSGNRLLQLAPDGTPYTNFPVELSEPMSNSDIVNRALQPPQPLPPPQQPRAQPGQPAITMTPGQARNEQFANSKQWQTTMTNEIKERKMLGLDPTEYIAEEKPGLTAGTLPEVQVRRKTPQEKQEDWINLNTLAMAGGGATIGPDGKPQAAAAPPIEVFDNTGAADAWIYTTAPDKNNKQDYAARLMYWQAAKPIRDKILGAAIRHPKFESKEEVQKFIQDLGVDARFKQLAINTMEKFLEKANPDLIANIRGDKLVEQANDKAILDFARQHATWAGADDMPDKELIVTAKKDPVMMAQMRRENRLFEQDPITHTPIIRPDTIESQAEKQFTMSSKQRQLQVEEYKALAKADPNLVFRLTPKGDPELVTKQVVLDENAERARKTRADEMAERKELYDIQIAEQEMKKRDLEETPAYKRAARQNDFKQKMMAARMTDIEDRFRDDLKAERTGEIEPGTANFNRTRAYSELDSDPRYKMDPLPGEEAPATATPATAAAQQPPPQGGAPQGTPGKVEQAPPAGQAQGQMPAVTHDALANKIVVLTAQLERTDLSEQERLRLEQAKVAAQKQMAALPNTETPAVREFDEDGVPVFSDVEVIEHLVKTATKWYGDKFGAPPLYRILKKQQELFGDIRKWSGDQAKALLKDIMVVERENMREEWKRQHPDTATPAPAAAQQPQSSTEQPAVSLAPPQVGEVRKGYIYLGGDPKLPTSWRRQ
mgnify:CR=1 FL=1